ncbi:MAG: hypothetical protein D6803_02820 [Anaerolineae bacterium]|nr:MAG: hypothetical protein D6803_02820 [Anaerolineae bacterium]
MTIPLKTGSRVGIIGGGPAGSFAALHLLHLARQRGLKLRVQIYEPRDFSRPGPAGCNRCAGVLSSRLVRGLETLGISIPSEVIQTAIHAYAIHLDGEMITLHQPDESRKILSIYRGGGPAHGSGDLPPSFDAFLLRQACARGAQHIPHRVHRVRLQNGLPVLYTREAQTPVDFLVVATGINSRPPLEASFGYRPPPCEQMMQDEVSLPANWASGEVHAWFPPPAWLTFGALIPKGRYLNVSLLGKHIPRGGIRDFLDRINLPGIDGRERLCGCQPRIATGPAKGYYGDRWVVVGDAAFSRLYKDGIGAAFYGARVAMRTAIEQGIHRQAFHRFYRPHCRQVIRDNRYGRALYALWHLTLRIRPLRQAWLRAVLAERRLPPQRRIHERVLWGMLTGDESYRSLLLQALSPSAVFPVLKQFITQKRGIP